MRSALTHVAFSRFCTRSRVEQAGPQDDARRSREARLAPTSFEWDAHQRLRPLVAEHPCAIHPRVSLVIDTGAPGRLIPGGQRARHEQIPAGSRLIAFDLDMAVQTVMDREGEDTRRASEKVADRLPPLVTAER